MSEIGPVLRKSTKRIPDRPRSPPRYGAAEILYTVPGSHLSWPQKSRLRPCSAATLILETCQLGRDLSQVPQLIEDLPNWVKEEFLKRGLENALTGDNVETARIFLSQGAPLSGNDVLRLAQSGNRSIEMYELFLEYGWDTNQPGSWGDTVLGWVVDDEELVRWLLSRNANPNFGRPQTRNWSATAADPESGFALDRAACTSSVAVVKLLLEAGAKLEYSATLHEAAESLKTDVESFQIMQYILSVGIGIDAMDIHPRGAHGHGSPLMCLVRRGDSVKIGRVRWLLEHGADPCLKNWRGTSPLDEARRLNLTVVLSLFAEFCPSINETETG